MKMVSTEIKHKAKVVSTIDIVEYESFDEMISAEKNDHILSLFNKQNKIQISAVERTKFSAVKGGAKIRRQLGYEALTLEELQSTYQDADALEALVFSDEVQARIKDKLPEVEEVEDGVEVEG